MVCALLIAIILMQSGRGGGLTESFAAAESMFGAKTNSILIRATTVLSLIFLVTSLSLAFLSTQQRQSLMSGADISEESPEAPQAHATAAGGAEATATADAQKAAENAQDTTTQQTPPVAQTDATGN